MPTDLPPNLVKTGAAAIVRQAENKASQAASAQKKENKRLRDEAMSDAAAQRRTPGTSSR